MNISVSVNEAIDSIISDSRTKAQKYIASAVRDYINIYSWHENKGVRKEDFEDSEKILIYSGDTIESMYTCILEVKDGMIKRNYGDPITHWMPILPAPKVEKEPEAEE